MTYDQYWYGDPLMVRAFYKASQLALEKKNNEAWLNGLYFSLAISSTIGNAFNQGDPIEYPLEPINFREQKKEEESWSEDDPDAVYAKAYMLQMVQAGRNWGKNASHEEVIPIG